MYLFRRWWDSMLLVTMMVSVMCSHHTMSSLRLRLARVAPPVSRLTPPVVASELNREMVSSASKIKDGLF